HCTIPGSHGAPRARGSRERCRAPIERSSVFRPRNRCPALCGCRSRLPRRLNHHGRGPQAVKYTDIAYRLPRALRRHVLYFEAEIEEAIRTFAARLPERARVLDAGAGEAHYARWFGKQRYCGVDLGIGDAAWDYSRLSAVADLTALPFRNNTFD